MYPDRWPEIDDLFQRTLDRQEHERRAFLKQACGDDTTLWKEVSSLLAAHDKAGPFMDERTLGLDVELQACDDAWIGRVVGPYRILRPIGHGGMSTVFLASRVDDEVESEVAIKVIRHGLGSSHLRRRFLMERQILADLDHPNIAKLYDAGTTEEGVPYFVMELIDGVTILEYCDRETLSVAARLELFREVCAAVQAAHQNLIVHRDIKPANVLVTSDGRPRLLDFGIAKPLDSRAFKQSFETTRSWQRPMTLAYASPEQVRGETVTTTADVYSLGIVLYELLTGCHPHRLGAETVHDLEDVILRQKPLRPSVAILQTSQDSGRADREQPGVDEIVRRRGVTVRQLVRQLAGDIDNIVSMALRKDPKRRYGSVEQLAEDLLRHRNGLPVVARKSSLGYRARKFIRRNKLAVAATTVVATLIVGFAIAMAFLAAQIAGERDLVRLANLRENLLASRIADLAENQEKALEELQQEKTRRLEAEAEGLALAGKYEEAERLRTEVEQGRETLRHRARTLEELRRALGDFGAWDSEALRRWLDASSLMERQLQDVEQQRRALAVRISEAEKQRDVLGQRLRGAEKKIRDLELELGPPAIGTAACQPGDEVEDQGIALVHICAGTFVMGSAEDDPEANEIEKPAHEVTLGEFWLGKYEITNEQYRRFRADHPGEAKLPATNVRWNQAKRFCEQFGFALPTEAEWEFAARAGSLTRWFFGDDEDVLDRYAWYAKNSHGGPHPIGQKEPNTWGLHDIHGNVWEWVADFRGPYSAAPQVDPTGLPSALALTKLFAPRSNVFGAEPAHPRVLRGGAFDAEPADLRATARGGSRLAAREQNIGFRCVRRPSRQR